MPTTLTRTALALPALGLAAGLLAAAPATAAAPPARTPVTVGITAQGVELSGVVTSRRLACKKNRTVWVWQQVGARGGGDDVRRFSDTTGRQSGQWVWSAGNTGVEGRFYAVVKAAPGCRRAVSRTVRAVRTD